MCSTVQTKWWLSQWIVTIFENLHLYVVILTECTHSESHYVHIIDDVKTGFNTKKSNLMQSINYKCISYDPNAHSLLSISKEWNAFSVI
jgi:hypothetical protein